LDCLRLIDNPDLNIPDEILDNTEDPQAILSYYFETLAPQVAEADVRPLHEAKLILVGQGAVGKTSLVNRLLHDTFNPAENITEGIEVTPWDVQVDGDDIRLNIWDFGGQEIMHATHQFFLSRRSLYLLVIDARQDEGDNRMDYWFRIIETFGKDSPIILVVNKSDQRPLDLDERGLLAKYRQLRAIVSTSCKDGAGIEVLKAEIVKTLAEMTHIYDKLPLPWFKVKQQLEQLKGKRNTLSYDGYEELCEREGLTQQGRETLLGFLHDLGVVLNFRDHVPLENTHILNPTWVTNGVYQIINDKPLVKELEGVLDPPNLKRILSEKEYNRPALRAVITAMMNRFELSHTFLHNSHTYHLIPTLLPKDQPETGEWEDSLCFEYHYDVLPSSLIARLIVRLFTVVEVNRAWRNGVS
jgi:internalin A